MPRSFLLATATRASRMFGRILPCLEVRLGGASGVTKSDAEIARSEGIVPSYVTRLFRLTLLAPDIVSAILGGKHPPELNARKLLDNTRLPLDWNEQRRSLGFA